MPRCDPGISPNPQGWFAGNGTRRRPEPQGLSDCDATRMLTHWGCASIFDSSAGLKPK